MSKTTCEMRKATQWKSLLIVLITITLDVASAASPMEKNKIGEQNEGFVSPIVTRTPNGTFIVTNSLSVVIENPPVSDFLAVVGYPETCQYYDIEWIKPPPKKYVRKYEESGDRYICLSETNCRKLPKIETVFRATFYRVVADFSKIDKCYPYNKSSKTYRDNTRPKEARENLKIKAFREVVAELKKESKDNPLDYARLAYAYVANNFKYGEIPNGPEPMLERAFRSKKSGDCGPVHEIFVQLCRAGGVPARTLNCLRPCLDEGRHHVTSEFYLEKWGWIPADFFGARNDEGGCPEKGCFGRYSDHTIAMVRGIHFNVKSAGGKRLVMGFNQGLNWWSWNFNGACGKPHPNHLFDGVRVEEESCWK